MEQFNFGNETRANESGHLNSFAKSNEEFAEEKRDELSKINLEIDEFEHSVSSPGGSQSLVNKFLLKFGIGKEKMQARLNYLYKHRMDIERSIEKLEHSDNSQNNTLH